MKTQIPITNIRYEIEQHGKSIEDILTGFPNLKVHILYQLNSGWDITAAYFTKEEMNNHLETIPNTEFHDHFSKTYTINALSKDKNMK